MMHLADVMSKRVATTDESKTVRQAARVMHKRGIGSIVVKRGAKVIGIVTERDVLKVVATGKDPQKVRVKNVMSTPVVVGTEATDLQQAIKIMVTQKIKKLPVLRGQRLVGIVTITDFARIEPMFHEIMERALRSAHSAARKKAHRHATPRDAHHVMYG